MALTEISFWLLRPSELNPRKHFDPESLAELAESIAGKGMLQNLVVREGMDTTGAGTYEIVAGERRWRAVKLLVEAGRLPERHPIPCNVIVCDDVELLKIATAENVARASMTPLEEADAFQRLTMVGVSTEEIAGIVGKSQKFVQIRIALLTKTAPQVRQALEVGTVSVDAARHMTMASQERQAKVLADMTARPDNYRTVADVKRALTAGMIAAEIAVFPLALYDGETVTDDDGKRWLTDAAQFERLQVAAAKDMAEALRRDEHAPWVKIMDSAKGDWFYSHNWHTVPGHAKAGAVVEITSARRVAVHRDLVAPADLAPVKPKPTAAAAADEGPGEPTKAHLVACRQQKTMMLQDAVADLPAAAMRICILGLLGAEQVKISGQQKDAEDRVISPGLLAILSRWAERFPAILLLAGADASPTAAYATGPLRLKAEPLPHYAGHYTSSTSETQAAAWRVLADLPDAEVGMLFAALVAERFASLCGFNPDYGDQALPLAVAETLNLPAAAVPEWRPDDDFLSTLRKPQLLALCQSLGMIGGPAQLKAYAARRTDELRRAILARADHAHADQVPAVLPTISFGTPKEVEKDTKAWLADPAKAGKATKRRKVA